MSAPLLLHDSATPSRCRHRHKAFRLTCDAYDLLVEIAGDSCQICGIPRRFSGTRGLHLDHDHSEGGHAVRGLVCNRCNAGLGQVDRGAREPDAAEVAYLSHPFYLQLSDADYLTPRNRRPSASGTTREAATLAGLSIDAFNKAMQRERAKGRDYRYPVDQWYSGKAPKWDLTAVAMWSAEKKREAGQ